MNPFRNLPHPPKSFKPVKKILLQELIYLVVVKLSAALLKMLDLVETCILDLERKTALNSIAIYIGYERTRSI
jgi:hypothetical protein